ncbi:MAG: glycosyltransferase [Amaricoccus sp.]
MPRRAPRILLVHDNFPAQFGGLGRWLAAQGWEVAFATAAAVGDAGPMRILRYRRHRAPSAETHPYAQPMDRAAINAQGFVRAALAVRREGYRPDVVVAHSGWGAGMFAKDVFPEAAFIAYCEWWYRHPAADVEYLDRLEGRVAAADVEAPMHERARNAPIAMDLGASDAAICPTEFQASQFPPVFRRHLAVMHDGIDTGFFRPSAQAGRSTLGGLVAEDARVVSYATRGMEPHRGFPQFMAALPAVLRSDPKAVAVIAGENRVVYGGERLRSVDWKARAMAENDLDPSRVHFVGRLAAADYLRLLQRSSAHVYLTVPFVLSWSMLEAMSAGCGLALSDTPPVREHADEASAILVDLARPATIAEAVLELASVPPGRDPRRVRARERVREALSAERQHRLKAKLFAGLLR